MSCECGTLRGVLRDAEKAGRGVCYCRDCQAYAHFLGRPERILDAAGGTDIVATIGPRVTLTQGLESLACMSLSPRGALRWYARCCNTPIANTMRNHRLAYVGLVHNCLEGPAASLDRSFGTVRMRANTASAKGAHKPKATPIRVASAVARIASSVALARVTGRYARSPFFDAASGAPVVQPVVITREERARLAEL